MNLVDPQSLLRGAFAAAVAAASPESCLPQRLPRPPVGRTVVVGAGKAAAAMAHVVEQHWPGELTGCVVTAYGHGVDCRRITVLQAGHPLPGEAGERAAQEILRRVTGLGRDDLVLCLLSGGGSALTPLPVAGLSLAGKRRITEALLRSGATIGSINCVRRHLSLFKGGRLGVAAHPARLVTLAISDVPGDVPVDIASGPTVGDPSTCADALAILDQYRVELDAGLRAALQAGRHESVKPGDPRLVRSEFHIVASAQQSLEAAARFAGEHGIAAHVLSDRVEGEAREVGQTMAELVNEVLAHGQPYPAPCLLLSGGETTVTVSGSGRGGRNVEFLLAFGLALGPSDRVWALAADTDGVDGMVPAAGATWGPATLERAAGLPIAARRYLECNDAHSFFEALDAALVTGPTRTNVNDFRAVLILPPRHAQA